MQRCSECDSAITRAGGVTSLGRGPARKGESASVLRLGSFTGLPVGKTMTGMSCRAHATAGADPRVVPERLQGRACSVTSSW